MPETVYSYIAKTFHFYPYLYMILEMCVLFIFLILHETKICLVHKKNIQIHFISHIYTS